MTYLDCCLKKDNSLTRPPVIESTDCLENKLYVIDSSCENVNPEVHDKPSDDKVGDGNHQNIDRFRKVMNQIELIINPTNDNYTNGSDDDSPISSIFNQINNQYL
tara:strand:- start:177 stop:491 length:315 start_codon:yes stop_codon:yes gene_type:complete